MPEMPEFEKSLHHRAAHLGISVEEMLIRVRQALRSSPMQGECLEIIGASMDEWDEGLPDELADHAEKCPMCAAFLEVSYKSTVEDLRAKWHAGEPERLAEKKFCEEFNAWLKTWRGKIYLYLGGPYWSRRAKFLGIPQRQGH